MLQADRARSTRPSTDANARSDVPAPLLSLALLATAPLAAQDAAQKPAQKPSEPHFVSLHWPKDKATAIAVVGSRTLTLGDLVDHLDGRHHPGFRDALEKTPTVEAMLRSDLMAPWVRHFADLEVLRQVYASELADTAKLEAATSQALKQSFEGYLKGYVENLQQQGRPTELSQQRINKLLADYQLRAGLAAELQGMLDFLEPGDYPREVLHAFYTQNGRVFGGQVVTAHILVQHRDAGTAILLGQQGIAMANERLAKIRGLLKPDGSNFEEVARLYSEDSRTAPDGGRLGSLHRYDDRMPATLCKRAWELRDGEVSLEPIETQYGFHFVKRLDFTQNVFILFTDDAIPSIQIVVRRARQEDRLLKARQAASVRLLV